jgi:hypothetical protein
MQKNSVIAGVPRWACRPAWNENAAAVRSALLYFEGALADDPASARSHADHPADSKWAIGGARVGCLGKVISTFLHFFKRTHSIRHFLCRAGSSTTCRNVVEAGGSTTGSAKVSTPRPLTAEDEENSVIAGVPRCACRPVRTRRRDHLIAAQRTPTP